jgi:hypothetical protein
MEQAPCAPSHPPLHLWRTPRVGAERARVAAGRRRHGAASPLERHPALLRVDAVSPAPQRRLLQAAGSCRRCRLRAAAAMAAVAVVCRSGGGAVVRARRRRKALDHHLARVAHGADTRLRLEQRCRGRVLHALLLAVQHMAAAPGPAQQHKRRQQREPWVSHVHTVEQERVRQLQRADLPARVTSSARNNTHLCGWTTAASCRSTPTSSLRSGRLSWPLLPLLPLLLPPSSQPPNSAATAAAAGGDSRSAAYVCCLDTQAISASSARTANSSVCLTV